MFPLSTCNYSITMSTGYHHGDLKAELLAYVRELMEHADIDGLSMREMAKAVGVSHTAAYRHFADKRALLDAVAVQGFEDLLKSSRAAVDCAPATPRSRLKASGLAYVSFGLASPRLLGHMSSAVSQPQASAALTDAGARLFESLRQLVSEGQQQGSFRTGDVGQLSHSCWAMVHGLAMLLGMGLLRTPQASHESMLAYAEQALEVFLDGMQQRKAPAHGAGAKAVRGNQHPDG